MVAASPSLTACKQARSTLPHCQGRRGMPRLPLVANSMGSSEAVIAGAEAPRSRETTVIRPTRGPIPPRLGELWTNREVFAFLVWRDIKVRYAQTALGAAWMVFQPLAMLLVYTFAFSRIAEVVIPGTPYAVFALAGLTMWIFVSRGVVIGAQSLL